MASEVIGERREYKQQWYRDNKERLNKKRKKNYQNNKQQEIMKNKKWREEHEEEYHEWRLKYLRDRRLKAVKLLGGTCKFCRENSGKLILHEIYGRHHSQSAAELVLFKKSKDFVPLHFWCHKFVHAAMKRLGMSWKEIEERLTR